MSLSACRANNTPTQEDNSNDAISKAAYQIAWKFIVHQIDQSTSPISNANISRLELVDTYENEVYIYALEYVYSIEGQPGYFEGGSGRGSPYLFISGQGEEPQLLGVKFTREILYDGGFATITINLLEEGSSVNLTKHSTGSHAFDTAEIEAAIRATRNYYDGKFEVINVWFDDEIYESVLEDYKENTLYDMNIAASSGNLIVMRCDLYEVESEFDLNQGLLHMGMNIVLMRDKKGSAWEVADQGYG